MSGFSEIITNSLLNYIFRGETYIPPENIYFALFGTAPTKLAPGTEVAGNGYARPVCDSWKLASGGGTQNNITVSFPTPSGAWGIIGWFGIYDALTGGIMIAYGALSETISVEIGDIIQINTGDLDISLFGDISAAEMPVDTSNFSKNLTNADNTAQKALETLDKLSTSGLALGDTETTAYRGDHGKYAYDHSLETGNPHGTTAEEITQDSNHRFSTDSEKSEWNAAYEKSLITANVVTADPEMPMDGESWIRHQRIIDFSATVKLTSGSGNMIVLIASNRPSDYDYFGTQWNNTTRWIGIDLNLLAEPHSVQIIISAMGMSVRGGPDTTWGEIIIAVNSWCVSHLDTGVSPILTLSNIADSTVIITELQIALWLTANMGGNPRTAIKYHKDGTTYQYASSLAHYNGEDPSSYFPWDVWLKYSPAVPGTGLTGALYFGMGSTININIISGQVADLELFGQTGGGGLNGEISFTWWDGMPPEETYTIQHSWSGILIQHYHAIMGDVMDALAGWFGENKTDPFASISIIFGNPSDRSVEINQYQGECWLNGNGIGASMAMNVFGPDSQIWTTGLYGGGGGGGK